MTTYEWLSFILVLCGGFWVLSRQLSKIEVGLSGKVSYKNCTERQEKCPCIQKIEEIKDEINKLHPHQK